MSTVFVKHYSQDIPVNRQQIWRYAGLRGEPDQQLQDLLETVIEDLGEKLSYRVCYRCLEALPFGSQSKDLEQALHGSDVYVVFAATIGLELDRYISRFQHTSATRALLAQAYGTERIEALCDVFCNEMAGCTRRYSPGYGDLPLQMQKQIFALLDCGKNIGVSLNESLLMTPSKSVTAIFGIGAANRAEDIHKCENCNHSECNYRR